MHKTCRNSKQPDSKQFHRAARQSDPTARGYSTSPQSPRLKNSTHIERWSAKDTNHLVRNILHHLPAIILAIAVLVTACLEPGSIVGGLGAIAAAIKSLWR